MRIRALSLGLLACAACAQVPTENPTTASPTQDPSPSPSPTPSASPSPESTPFEWTPLGTWNPDGPLCEIPVDFVGGGGDPVNPPCAVASGSFTDRDPSMVPAVLRVATWNIRYGLDSATILDELSARPELAEADVLLLNEVARRDLSSVPAGIDQARDLAEALRMDYVFAVEWDRRLHADQGGEHGVAVLSKYPLGNVTPIRHVPLFDWYADDQRYGGRLTLGADALVGGVPIRFFSSHLCTRGTGDAGRASQAAEIRADADLPGRPERQVVGGDLNTWTCSPVLADCTTAPAAESLVEDFLGDGWNDGTSGFNGWTQLGQGFFPQRLDWLFYRGVDAVPGTALQDAQGSDHVPVVFELSPDT